MKASRNCVSSLAVFGFLVSFSALGDVTIPGNFNGTSDDVYGGTPAKAVELAGVAAKNAAWQQHYGNCALKNYNYWPSGNHYAASANLACTNPGEYIPLVVVFTFTGATDQVFDLILDKDRAIDTAVSRAEAAARAEGYSECKLKNYNYWQPSPPSQKWAASAVVDCSKGI
ncbi:hypothetical protein FHR56_000211 [Xanthomonas sacchari]|uniref:hypothetical protein n=1 Tax=unclassified Xanthomonas TaxID=2643310 RepID=UPI001370B3A9|nr:MULTISPECIES: hypothetical protein [unclassified Xanthomonas]MBB6365098.1 hypothetical protein [Xanthomonas sp. F10]